MACSARPPPGGRPSVGSWGVGRDTYRVRTEDGRVFDLYYDRSPTHAGDRTGEWFLYRGMREEDPELG